MFSAYNKQILSLKAVADINNTQNQISLTMTTENMMQENSKSSWDELLDSIS